MANGRSRHAQTPRTFWRAGPTVFLVLLWAGSSLSAQSGDAKKNAPSELPSAQVDGVDVLILNESGAIAGNLKGKKGSTQPDGRVEVEEATLAFYPRSASREGAQVLPAPNVSMSVGKVIWHMAQRRIECSGKLTLAINGDSVKDGQAMRLQADAAVITYVIGKESIETVWVKDASNVTFEGYDLSLTAPFLDMTALFSPQTPELGATDVRGISGFTMRAPRGLDTTLPPTFDIAGDGALRQAPLHAICEGEATLDAHDPGGDGRLTLTMRRGARVGIPRTSPQVLVADTLTLSGKSVKGKFSPDEILAETRVSAAIRRIQGTARRLNILLEERPGGLPARAFTFSGDPEFWIRRQTASGEDEGSRLVELRSRGDILVLERPEGWSLSAGGEVRARMVLDASRSVRMNGERFSLDIDAPVQGQSPEQFSPERLAGFVCQGAGGLARLSMFHGDTGSLALYAESVEGARVADGGFIVDLQGETVRASLHAPVAILASRALGAGDAGANDPTEYIIASKGRAAAHMSDLAAFAPGSQAVRALRFMTTEDTTLEESPSNSRTRSTLDCGPLELTLRLRSGPDAAQPALEDASLRAQPGTAGRVRTVAAYDIIDSGTLDLSVTTAALDVTFGSPVSAVLRSPWALELLQTQLAMRERLFAQSRSPAPAIDAAVLTSDGPVMQSVVGGVTSARDARMRIDGALTLQGYWYGHAPRMTGSDALVEWDALKEKEHTLHVALTAGGLMWRTQAQPQGYVSFALSMTSPVSLSLPGQNSTLACGNLDVQGAKTSLTVKAKGPLTAYAGNNGRTILFGMLRGANAAAAPGTTGGSGPSMSSDAASRYTQGFTITCAESLEVRFADFATGRSEWEVTGPFTMSAPAGTGAECDTLSGAHLNCRLKAANAANAANANPAAVGNGVIEHFRLDGGAQARTGTSVLKGDVLSYDVKTGHFLLDGSDVAMQLGEAGHITGVRTLEIQPSGGRGDGNLDTSRLRARGKRITLTLGVGPSGVVPDRPKNAP